MPQAAKLLVSLMLLTVELHGALLLLTVELLLKKSWELAEARAESSRRVILAGVEAKRKGEK